MSTENLRLYLDFVHNRHEVWEKRQRGEAAPWTDDPIIANYKFTNVYRVLDHGTQFVLRLLYEDEPSYSTALFRAFLYRYTNRPEPWERFYDTHGRMPNILDSVDGTLLFNWWEQRHDGLPIFGNAFKMFSGAENKGTDRLTWAVHLARDVFADRSFMRRWVTLRSQEERMALLKTIPRVADFMGMQILTDIGYSQWLQSDENEFIVPGPGAKRGAAEIFGSILSAEQAIRELQPTLACGLELPDGTIREPSLMDVQNTLCEFSKYMRYYRHPSPRQGQYNAVHTPGEPFYPTHWHTKEKP